jgi:hypothetical protein
VDLREEVLGALLEELVGELPPVCHDLPEPLLITSKLIRMLRRARTLLYTKLV